MYIVNVETGYWNYSTSLASLKVLFLRKAGARVLFQMTHWQFVDLLAPPLYRVKAAQLVKKV